MNDQVSPIAKAALTVAEFCQVVGIGKTTFYSEVRAGRIHPKKIGSKTIVPATEASAFLDRLPDMTNRHSAGPSKRAGVGAMLKSRKTGREVA